MGRRRWIFLAVSSAGLLAWALWFSPLTTWLFRANAAHEIGRFPLFRFLGLPLMVLVSAVAGYAAPRRFWLWGGAVVLPRPVASILRAGYEVHLRSFRPIDFWSAVLIETFVFTVLFGVVCVFGAALGAGARQLVERSARRFRGASPSR